MQSSVAAKASGARSYGRWYVLVLISLMYLITYLDRVNISTAAPVIAKEFGFDKVTAPLLGSPSARPLSRSEQRRPSSKPLISAMIGWSSWALVAGRS
jgi:hypothetical protein